MLALRRDVRAETGAGDNLHALSPNNQPCSYLIGEST